MTIDLAAGGYATEEDYDAWIGPDAAAPAGVVQLLRSATFVVAWACNRNPYQDDPTSIDAAPLRDATCAQVQSWTALGITPANAGIVSAAIVRKTSILAADVEYDTSGQLAALQMAAKDIGAEARTILLAANLLWQPEAHGDESPYLLGYGLSGYTPWGAPLAEFEWPISWL